MAFFRRSEIVQEPVQASERRFEAFKSPGLKALIQSLRVDRKYSVLELGPAIGANIEFLSEFSSKIRVEDLYETLVQAAFFEGGAESLDETLISRIPGISSMQHFDIVLGWDLINYFKPDELKALIHYVDKSCRKGSLFFAIVSTLKEMPAIPTTFKILDAETLHYCAGSSEMRPCPRYAPRDLVLMMSAFTVQESYLLQNGMQEYIFVRN